MFLDDKHLFKNAIGRYVKNLHSLLPAGDYGGPGSGDQGRKRGGNWPPPTRGRRYFNHGTSDGTFHRMGGRSYGASQGLHTTDQDNFKQFMNMFKFFQSFSSN